MVSGSELEITLSVPNFMYECVAACGNNQFVLGIGPYFNDTVEATKKL